MLDAAGSILESRDTITRARDESISQQTPKAPGNQAFEAPSCGNAAHRQGCTTTKAPGRGGNERGAEIISARQESGQARGPRSEEVRKESQQSSVKFG